MTVFTYPHKTGVPVDREVIIASGSSSISVSVTSLAIVNQVIPAHSIGIDGYLVIDLFFTRTGDTSAIIPLVVLNNSTVFSTQLGTAVNSSQTRLILYADHSSVSLKLSSQEIISTPYYKGFFAPKETILMNINVDNLLTVGLVILNPDDSATLEGYCIRTFNPSLSRDIISGQFQEPFR